MTGPPPPGVSEMPAVRYRTEVGWPFVLVYLLLVAVMGGPPVAAAMGGRPVPPPAVVLPVATLGFLAYLAVTTVYTLTGTTLVVRCGPFRTAVAFGAIRTLRASRNRRSAPALSLNRIEVLASAGASVLISPADRDGFVRDLLARAPHVTLEGLEAPRGGAGGAGEISTSPDAYGG